MPSVTLDCLITERQSQYSRMCMECRYMKTIRFIYRYLLNHLFMKNLIKLFDDLEENGYHFSIGGILNDVFRQYEIKLNWQLKNRKTFIGSSLGTMNNTKRSN